MDQKAKKILFKTYWSSAGWIDNGSHTLTPDEFLYAKEHGLMFDPLTISKDELITRLRNVVDAIPQKKITDAFLCSLSNKRLDYRSALASYANARRLLSEDGISEFYYGHGIDLDLNILNFERIKRGGVRHFSGVYNWLDLMLLEQDNIPAPTENDIDNLKGILTVISESEPGTTPGKLRDALSRAVAGSKNERQTLMEILGCAEILKPQRYDRKVTGTHDWTFVLHWRGEDKYDSIRTNELFGAYGIG